VAVKSKPLGAPASVPARLRARELAGTDVGAPRAMAKISHASGDSSANFIVKPGQSIQAAVDRAQKGDRNRGFSRRLSSIDHGR